MDDGPQIFDVAFACTLEVYIVFKGLFYVEVSLVYREPMNILTRADALTLGSVVM